MSAADDFATVIKSCDNLRILKHIRAHKLREPELVIKHGKLLLGETLSNISQVKDEAERLACIEQICIAALDVNDTKLADAALTQIKKSTGKESVRYRSLLALCLEGCGSMDLANDVYDSLLKENPSNVYAWKRKYCILKSQVGKEAEAREALNDYLERNGSDVSAWAEMAKFCAETGDYEGAAFCYEEVILSNPLSSDLHCTLAEWYATAGGVSNMKLARKHFAQSLELDGNNMRSMFGLVNAAEAYLDLFEGKKNKKDYDEEDIELARSVLNHGRNLLSKAYKGTKMSPLIEKIIIPDV